MNVFRPGYLRESCHNMINSFLELTTHTECCIYAIFEYFSSVRVGLDGLALSSDNKTHRFNFSPAVLSHLLVMCWATPSSPSHLCFACSWAWCLVFCFVCLLVFCSSELRWSVPLSGSGVSGKLSYFLIIAAWLVAESLRVICGAQIGI